MAVDLLDELRDSYLLVTSIDLNYWFIPETSSLASWLLWRVLEAAPYTSSKLYRE